MRIKKLNVNAGNKPRYGEKMIQTAFYARVDQLEWLRNQPQGVSPVLRDLIDKAMKKDAHKKAVNDMIAKDMGVEG